jgi:hypothetical protein
MLEDLLSRHSVTIDEGPVHAPQVLEHERVAFSLDEAVLLRDESVEQLYRVAGMASDRVVFAELYQLQTVRSGEY